MAAKLHFLFVLLGARNTFLWGKKIISMGYFFVKHYGGSTTENPLLHWIDEDYILRTQITQMDTDFFLEHEYSPTDNTDGHRFF